MVSGSDGALSSARGLLWPDETPGHDPNPAGGAFHFLSPTLLLLLLLGETLYHACFVGQ